MSRCRPAHFCFGALLLFPILFPAEVFMLKRFFSDVRAGGMIVLAVQTVFVSGAVLAAAVPISCRMTADGVKVVEPDDPVMPELRTVSVDDESTLRVTFSEDVSVSDCVVSDSAGRIGSTFSHEGKILTCTLDKPMEVGADYNICGVAESSGGNSLSFKAPFKGYNPGIPELIITEIQGDAVSSMLKDEKSKGTCRAEFVEVFALKGGNLAGLELVCASDGEEKKYEFPQIKVNAGEFVIVHMRRKGNGCESETGDNLNLSYGGYSVDGVRDLWADNDSDPRIGSKEDIIIIRNGADGKILDAAMYRKDAKAEWSKKMNEFSAKIDDAGIYESGDADNAFVADKKSEAKTISRKGLEEIVGKIGRGEKVAFPVQANADSWEITAANPGTFPNADVKK